jgi:hypothetical protein
VSGPPGWRSKHLVVLAQAPRAGARRSEDRRILLRLGPRPAQAKGCRPPRFSRILVRTGELIEWTQPESERGPHGEEEAATEGFYEYYACVPGNAHRYLFTYSQQTLSIGYGPERMHVAGHYIAFDEFGLDHYGSGSETLYVFDAAHGRRMNVIAYNWDEDQPEQARVRALALDAHGELAWVTEVFGAQHEPTGEELWLCDGSTNVAVESATRIGSPSFGDGQLAWQSEGMPHSRPL